MGQVDKELEELLIVFEVDPARAEAAAKKQTFDQFDNKFIRLESLIGSNHAYAVVKESSSIEGESFIDYSNSKSDEYFESAEKVAEILKDEIIKGPSERWYVPFFYSIQSLNTFLEKKDEIVLHRPKEDLALHKYYLFHSDNEQSKDYLDLLIRKGKITVGDSEHWVKSGKPNGVRGNAILKKIIYQLTSSFGELDLGRPNYTVNYGQNKLTVDNGTQKNLRIIRDTAYNS